MSGLLKPLVTEWTYAIPTLVPLSTYLPPEHLHKEYTSPIAKTLLKHTHGLNLFTLFYDIYYPWSKG